MLTAQIACSATPQPEAAPSAETRQPDFSKSAAGAASPAGRADTFAPRAGGGGAAPLSAATGSAGASGDGERRVTSAAGSAGLTGAAGSGGAMGLTGDAGIERGNVDDTDADAGPAGSSVTILAEADFAPVTLSVDGAACPRGRCVLPPPGDGKLAITLSLKREEAAPMPVLARWHGCGEPTTTFFPITPSGSTYVINYESKFQGLRAGATCTAEIVQGGWLVFAGDMSLRVTGASPYCTTLQVSEMGWNTHCFAPPDTPVELTSDLPHWSCIVVDLSGQIEDRTLMQSALQFKSVKNQLVSCTGSAQ